MICVLRTNEIELSTLRLLSGYRQCPYVDRFTVRCGGPRALGWRPSFALESHPCQVADVGSPESLGYLPLAIFVALPVRQTEKRRWRVPELVTGHVMTRLRYGSVHDLRSTTMPRPTYRHRLPAHIRVFTALSCASGSVRTTGRGTGHSGKMTCITGDPAMFS